MNIEVDIILTELESFLTYIRIRFPSPEEGAYILITDERLADIETRSYDLADVIEHFYPNLYRKLCTFLFSGYKKSGLSIKENLDLYKAFNDEYGVGLSYVVKYIYTVFGNRKYNKKASIKWNCTYSVLELPTVYDDFEDYDEDNYVVCHNPAPQGKVKRQDDSELCRKIISSITPSFEETNYSDEEIMEIWDSM